MIIFKVGLQATPGEANPWQLVDDKAWKSGSRWELTHCEPLKERRFIIFKSVVGAGFEPTKTPESHLTYRKVHLSYLTCAIFFGILQISCEWQIRTAEGSEEPAYLP